MRVTLGIVSFLHDLLFEQHIFPANSTLATTQCEPGLKSVLLRCGALSEAEIDAYIAYEMGGIVYEDVPLDYQARPGEEISCLYSDGVLQVKALRRHTNQISQETLEKVQRVLSELSCPDHP